MNTTNKIVKKSQHNVTSQTGGANTQDWLEAIKGIKISAYIQGTVDSLTRETFEDILRRVSRPIESKQEGRPDSEKTGI